MEQRGGEGVGEERGEGGLEGGVEGIGGGIEEIKGKGVEKKLEER